jgi:hypothetical protein
MSHRKMAEPRARPDFREKPIVANTMPVNRRPVCHSE